MAIEEERTGFEWLDRPFMMTRIWLSLLGTFFFGLLAYEMVYTVMFSRLTTSAPRMISGPEEEAEIRTVPDGLEHQTIRKLHALSVLSILPASIVILVWCRPRAGFLLGAIGGLPLWLPLALLPAGWLCFAAWKVGPTDPSPAAAAGTS